LTKQAETPETEPVEEASGGAEAQSELPEQPRRWRWLRRALWGLFLLVDLPLLVVVAIGLAAGNLHPRLFWSAQLLAIMLPYLVIPTLVAAAVTILMRKWFWLALHVVLLLLVGLRAFPQERFGRSIEPADGDLTLMSFNVPQSGPSAEILGDSMIALVLAEEPDIIGLQESWVEGARSHRPERRPPQIEAVVDSLSYRLAVPLQMSSQPAWRSNSTAVPLLFREQVGEAEVVEQTAVRLGESADPDISMAIRTHFRWQGREGVLYNIHLRSFGDQKPWNANIRPFDVGTWWPYLRQYRDVYRLRAEEVEALALQIDAEELPVIVLGDFNDTADTWTFKRLQGDRADAFNVAGAGSGHTYRSDKPFVRIDFALVDKAWEVVDAAVPNVRFSDHRPLVVRLRWRDR